MFSCDRIFNQFSYPFEIIIVEKKEWTLYSIYYVHFCLTISNWMITCTKWISQNGWIFSDENAPFFAFTFNHWKQCNLKTICYQLSCCWCFLRISPFILIYLLSFICLNKSNFTRFNMREFIFWNCFHFYC